MIKKTVFAHIDKKVIVEQMIKKSRHGNVNPFKYRRRRRERKKLEGSKKTITRLLKQFSSRDRNDFGLGSKQDQKALKSSLCFIVKPKYQLSVKFNNLSIF